MSREAGASSQSQHSRHDVCFTGEREVVAGWPLTGLCLSSIGDRASAWDDASASTGEEN